MKHKNKKLNATPYTLNAKQGGFTLLLSLIISGAVLSIGFSIFTIIIKEIRLSALGRESQIAFYAADAGIECALYWDYKERAFSDFNPSNPGDTTSVRTIYCGGDGPWGTAEKPLTIPDSGIAHNEFEINLENGSCVKVIIDKDLDAGPTQGDTTLRANGYNLACDSTSSRKVERSLKVDYTLAL